MEESKDELVHMCDELVQSHGIDKCKQQDTLEHSYEMNLEYERR